VTPIRLSDDEVAAILQAAKPIPRDRRRAFLVAVADQLAALGELRGPGTAHRAIVAAAHAYFDPPGPRWRCRLSGEANGARFRARVSRHGGALSTDRGRSFSTP